MLRNPQPLLIRILRPFTPRNQVHVTACLASESMPFFPTTDFPTSIPAALVRGPFTEAAEKGSNSVLIRRDSSADKTPARNKVTWLGGGLARAHFREARSFIGDPSAFFVRLGCPKYTLHRRIACLGFERMLRAGKYRVASKTAWKIRRAMLRN